MTTQKYNATADLLDEDKPISGQKFACVSFVSPEKILKQKRDYYFQEFVKGFDLEKSMTKFQQFLNFVAYKYDLNSDKVMDDFKQFTETERENLIQTTIEDDYKNFLDAREEELQNQFNVDHQFQTNVRGLKIRGVFPTQEEAELRCRMLREQDPNHDIYVGPVGVWMPFDPEAYRNGRVEYLEKELNYLMHEKQKNEEKAREEFEARVKESKRKAIEENKEKAAKTGATLSQDYKDGELVAVESQTENKIIEEAGEEEEVTAADIRKELFEGDDVRTKATDKERSVDGSVVTANTEISTEGETDE